MHGVSPQAMEMIQREIYTDKDGWTILTADGKASAHFEHTIAILEDGPQILSKVSLNG